MTQLDALRPRQFSRVRQLVEALVEGAKFTALDSSDIATDEFCAEFGDQLRLHHNASAIPLTKDKFEYALVNALEDAGHEAYKLGNGNPGADIAVDGVFWSLKTQADAAIKADRIHISKFMELGKGAWETAEDVVALREKMFGHLTKYERIFDLRNISRVPIADGSVVYGYELVEIPKALLMKSRTFPIEMKTRSRQTPKPASCIVSNDDGTLAYELSFDGGTERKLTIKSVDKRQCIVHATWSFTARA